MRAARKSPVYVKTPVKSPPIEAVGLDRNRIISELTKSPHGKLEEYIPIGQRAASEDPDFLAHLVAWNRYNGQIRDSKVALPILALTQKGIDAEHKDNALAHIASLGPREFLRAWRFGRQIQIPGRRTLRNLAPQYLRKIESNPAKWDRVAIQHRATLTELYALTHTKPCERAQQILFDRQYPENSIFADLKSLKDMSPVEAAGTIFERNLPFQQALGALGAKAKDPTVVLALINRMTPTQLVTSAKMLEKLGAATDPVLKAAMRKRLEKVGTSQQNVLKTTKAAEAIEDDILREQFRAIQEKQLSKFSIDGNWLVLADKSGSMTRGIETGKQVAAILSQSVRGQIWLVFFDSAPSYYDVTGKSLDEINTMTRHIKAGGGTRIWCGVEFAKAKGWDVQGIAVVSDGEDCAAAGDFTQRLNRTYPEVPLYFYKVKGGNDTFSNIVPMNIFDLTGGVDYYALPNIVKTMRVNKFSLVDEIMQTPLLTLDKVFAGVVH